jgi:hypothetical protein
MSRVGDRGVPVPYRTLHPFHLALGVSEMTAEIAPMQPAVSEPARPRVGLLDWVEFRARFFPGHRSRHDFEALVAYGTYQRGGAGPDSDGRTTPQVSVVTQLPEPVNGSNNAASSTELSSWESEGGNPRS